MHIEESEEKRYEFFHKVRAVVSHYEELGVTFDYTINQDALKLEEIQVDPEFRGQGFAKSLLSEITSLCDEYNFLIVLSPSNAFGSSLERLKKFYKSFGFVNNKGRNKDFRFQYSMIRIPKVRKQLISIQVNSPKKKVSESFINKILLQSKTIWMNSK